MPSSSPATQPAQRPYPRLGCRQQRRHPTRCQLNHPWLINAHAIVSMVADQWDMYKTALEEAGQPLPDALPMMRKLYFAEDRETAYSEVEPYLVQKYAAYAAWGQAEPLPVEESFSVPYQDPARDRFPLSSLEEAVTEVRRYEAELDDNYVIFGMQWPGIDQARVVRQMELSGETVIPQVKSG